MRIVSLAVIAGALVPLPAAAFDCSKATTAGENALCADPKARAADAQMAQAYFALLERESPADRPTIQAAQARWLISRDQTCDQAQDLAPCLARMSLQRRAFLAAETEAGPGAPGRLAPFFRVVKGGKGRADLNLQWLKFPAPANPSERAFNATLDAVLGPLDEPAKDDSNGDRYAHQRQLRLLYASPSLISAHLDAYDDFGAAHPSSFTANINIDLKREREAKFSDLATPDAARKIFALCRAQVKAQKKARGGELDDALGDLPAATGNLRAWSFGPLSATVTYDAYAVGSYAEGAYQCLLPYAKLKPLAQPDFPLPESP